ncbi:5-formyltetrahydrofolate cyclo-ligase [Actinoplanes sp. L3-i22]|uniref:5-formyltetrahydrofolate cyclo-ligase n=1 Tax=Actinoplanes sp. L3-i22 TaxID=2836373 RepID=UPI001C768978|nr:5-formyltetrahydrofolate cyclo-ligase [Actinoplanes sp. L3-i22]BCY15057.1 5-formyltetrahydrofolate cyclo-ligase [Actinoplanes sp. L3-i22]
MSDLAGAAEKSPHNKITLRTQLLTARRSLSATDRSDAARQLQDQTLALVRRKTPSTLAAYVPSGSEPGGPDLPDVLRAALPPGGRLLLPVLLPDNDLDWAEHTGTLTTGRRGLLEPIGPRLGVTALRSADLILVPALAVGRDGLRMGRGGGSYDRALSRLLTPAGSPGPLVVALLHDHEALDEVPAEPHDRPVHGVITPTAGFTPRPA